MYSLSCAKALRKQRKSMGENSGSCREDLPEHYEEGKVGCNVTDV
jgi:hypothetical protein